MPASSHLTSASRPAKESLALTVLRGLGRRWRLATILGVSVAAVVGAAIWFLVPPPLPTAAAMLEIPQKVSGKIGEHPDPPLERSSQLTWIRGRVVLNAALRAPGVADLPVLKGQEDPLDWLSKKITAEYLGAEVLRISLSHSDAEQAKTIVNAVTNAYLDLVANKSGADRNARLKQLEEYRADHETMLKRQRETIRVMTKGGAFDSERRIWLQNMLRMQSTDAMRQLNKAESELKAAKLKEKLFSMEGKIELNDPTLDKYVDADQRVKKAAEAVRMAEDSVEDTRKKAKSPTHAAVKDAEATLVTRKKEHEELRSRVRSEAQAIAMAQTKTERASQVQRIKAEISYLEEHVAGLRSEVDTYTKTLSDNKIMEAEIAPIQFELNQTERLLGVIVNALMMLKMEQDAPTRVRLMESATVTRVDAEKRRMMLSAGGAGASLFLVLAIIGLLEYRLRRIDCANTISHQLGIRLVGTVPNPNAGPMRWFVNNGHSTAALTEAIACTRTMLLHGEGFSSHRVLLITSPVSGEGKTSLSVQLGVSIALAGHKTLVIDGDLRNPTAHERLGVGDRPGLCELLRGEVSMLEVIRETTVPSLHVIPAGSWNLETSQALVTAPLSQLFAVWREQYEFVIIDSSPVLPVTDALLLARHADGVILSLLQGVSRVSQATEACQRFNSLGVNVLGVIVNGTPARTYGGSEKYYYTAKQPTEPIAEPIPDEAEAATTTEQA